MQVFVLRLWFGVIAVGLMLLVLAPFTYIAEQLVTQVQERVNRPQSPAIISRTESVDMPYAIDEDPIAPSVGGLRTLASGARHTCAVTRSSVVLCWGDNTNGQLGIGIAGEIAPFRASISPVAGLTDVSSIALGHAHTCALQNASATVWCWGDNAFRQLGDMRSGPKTSRPVAAQVIGVPATQQIVSGANHTCALTQSGDVWCWGDNQYSQIGQSPSNNGVATQRVQGLPTDVITISAGLNHTCARTQSGGVWCWGDNQQGQIDDTGDTAITTPRQIFINEMVDQLALANNTTCAVLRTQQLDCRGPGDAYRPTIAPPFDGQLTGSPLGRLCLITNDFAMHCWDDRARMAVETIPGIALVSTGVDFQCVLLRAGLVQCRGNNQQGQVGVATDIDDVTEFVFVSLGSSARVMSAGFAHVCTIWQLGKLICWGRNLEGQLGMPVQDSQPFSASPHEVALNGVIEVATAGNHTCVIRFDRRVSCWGDNTYGQLGVGDAHMRDLPASIRNLDDVKQIAVGLAHSCALQRDGAVVCWGDNRFGQTTGPELQQRTPYRVTELDDVVRIAAGGNTTCALQNNGLLVCWGAQIGAQPSFTALASVPNVVDFAVGYAHACAVQMSGSVYCWGDHRSAQNDTLLTKINELPPVRSVVVGIQHTCVLDFTQQVWCWGQNGQGQVNGVPSDNTFVTPEVQYRGTSHLVAGQDFTCVRQQIGTTVCWGGNRYGQLGIDDTAVHFNNVATVNDGFDISSGGNHSCVLLREATMRCWGDNAYGQLGDGTTNTSPVPQSVRSNESFVAIDAGLAHTCAIVNDGTVRCWGHNNFGQLGNETTENASSPVITAVQNVRKLALGNSHACALLSDGGGACWGRNDEGQLGVGGTANSAMPLRVADLEQAIDIDSGADHVCVVRQDGTVWCWGRNQQGQLGLGEAGPGVSIPSQVPGIFNAIAVSLGNNHSCVLTADRTVWCWGSNNYGQAGFAQIDDKSVVARPQQVPGLSDIIQLHVGGNHSCALTPSADALCWGDNFNGQLGNSTVLDVVRHQPVAVTGLSRFVGLSAGGAHTCGLLQDGDVLCWGWNRYGQVGNGSGGFTADVLIPQPVVTLSNIAAVAVGASHACATDTTGAVSCWGDNTNGQLGTGVFGDAGALALPRRVSLLAPGMAVTVGSAHACAMLTSTELACWGSNEYGQIGNGFVGEIANTAVANFVSGLIGVTDFASGGNTNCAIRNGEVYCWGDNQYAQVGQPTVGVGDVRAQPTKVDLLTEMRSVVVGKHHACALSETGIVYCWGRNNQAQLGGFVGELSALPSVVQHVTDVIQISAGDDHTCAVTAQGTLYCWGSNNAGQLGYLASDESRTSPLADVKDVQQVATGSAHTCVFDGNSVMCWGNNDHGQLGLGMASADTTAALNRLTVANLPPVQSLYAGGNHSCVITASNGEIWCWGQNENAQLGVTNNPDMNAPVAVIDLWSMQVNAVDSLDPTPVPTARMRVPTPTMMPTQTPAPTATLIRPVTP